MVGGSFVATSAAYAAPEHGIGFAKAKYLGLELTPETIAAMRAVKLAFDPLNILNPGKIFPA